MKDFNLVYPKNPQAIEIIMTSRERYVPLSRIKWPRGQCKWCLGKTETKRKEYCSKDCTDSAWAFFYPQKHAHSIFMKRQNGCCNGCGYNFNHGTKKFKRKDNWYNWNRETKKRELVKSWEVEHIDYGDVDHVIPIYQGGDALGIDNHQLLCKDCHKIKTVKDRKADS